MSQRKGTHIRKITLLLLVCAPVATPYARPGVGGDVENAPQRPASSASCTPTFNYASREVPNFPSEAKRLGESGTTVVDIHIGSDGVPLKTSVYATSGFDALDQAAMTSAMRWRFTSVVCRESGQATEAYLRVPISFGMKSHESR